MSKGTNLSIGIIMMMAITKSHSIASSQCYFKKEAFQSNENNSRFSCSSFVANYRNHHSLFRNPETHHKNICYIYFNCLEARTTKLCFNDQTLQNPWQQRHYFPCLKCSSILDKNAMTEFRKTVRRME